MFNIRYGIKFMAEHVVFMVAADTSNDVMHFLGRRKEKPRARHHAPNMTFYLAQYMFRMRLFIFIVVRSIFFHTYIHILCVFICTVRCFSSLFVYPFGRVQSPAFLWLGFSCFYRTCTVSSAHSLLSFATNIKLFFFLNSATQLHDTHCIRICIHIGISIKRKKKHEQPHWIIIKYEEEYWRIQNNRNRRNVKMVQFTWKISWIAHQCFRW